MEILIAVGVSLIIGAIEFTVNRIGAFRLSVRERKLAEAVLASSPITERDSELAERSSEIINRICVNQSENAVSGVISVQSETERLAISDALVNELAALYHVDVARIIYMYDTQSGRCGSYNADSNYIYLNAALFMTSDEECIAQYIGTIVHELRHAVQCGSDDVATYWEVAPERRAEWQRNIADYVRSDVDYEGYRKQPIEADAAAFKHAVLEGVLK